MTSWSRNHLNALLDHYYSFHLEEDLFADLHPDSLLVLLSKKRWRHRWRHNQMVFTLMLRSVSFDGDSEGDEDDQDTNADSKDHSWIWSDLHLIFFINFRCCHVIASQWLHCCTRDYVTSSSVTSYASPWTEYERIKPHDSLSSFRAYETSIWLLVVTSLKPG